MCFGRFLSVLVAIWIIQWPLPLAASAAESPFFEAIGAGYGRATTYQVALGDLDADGDLDVLVPEYGYTGGPNTLWRNVFGE